MIRTMIFGPTSSVVQCEIAIKMASEQIPLPVCNGFKPGAFARGVGAADVACGATDGIEAFVYGVGVAALECV